MKRRNATIEPLEVRRMLSAAMVKDLNTAPAPLSGLWTWVAAENNVFLSQDDGVAGWELYKSDGTAGGSVLVKDIRPGRDNSQPGWLTYAGNGTIFFAADDGTHGVELWKSDGTEAGTVLVKDINPGLAASGPGSLINVNGTIYFSATDGVNGAELWKSDGTEAGTVMVKNIAGGANVGSSPTQLINNNGTVFFRASNVTSGFELWKSDGTDIGTVQVKEIANNNNNGVNNVPMAVRNGFVYFSGSTPTNGSELWRSDGTDLGTTMVKEIYATSTSSSPTLFKTSGNFVYFNVSAGAAPGLYRTDGTDPGTVRLTTVSIGNSQDVNGTLFFANPSASFTYTGLFTTDGNTVTTVNSTLVMDSRTGPWLGLGSTLYFTARDAATGEELWKSDGTPGGTAMVKDIEPGPVAANPTGLLPLGPGGSSGIIFTVNSAAAGSNGGVWRSDGTSGGTTFVKDLYPGTDSAGPLLLTPFKDYVYFIASEPLHSGGGLVGELYRSDGTDAGTGNFADLIPGPTSASVSQLRAYGDYLYFAANDGSGVGRELWRTDGTSVTFIKDINPGTPDSGINGGIGSGNYFYFLATTAAQNEELWRTDGTSIGTIRLTDIAPGNVSSQINLLTDVNGTLYFTAFSAASTFAGLWKTDGNAITQVANNTVFSSIASMINIGGTLYISGTTTTNGAELYKITPGSSTPVLVKDIATSGGSSSPGNLTNVDGTLFFTATTSANGTELWKSDGTDAGTQLVKDIRSGSSSSMTSSASMVAANGVAYFRADDGVGGIELWRSDGTAAGTYLVKDIVPPGITSGNPNRLYAANGFVYFSAFDDNSNTPDAWRTDGTAAGTVPITDFPKGTFITYPSNAAFFTALNGEVYFLFTDDTHGSELWKADQPDFATLGAGGVLTITGTANNDVIEVFPHDDAGTITVTLNGMTEFFGPGQVTSLNIATGIGRDQLTVSGGFTALSSDAGINTPNLAIHVASNGALIFNATQHLRDLDVDGTATLSQGGAKVIVTRGLSVDGKLNLMDNDLVLNYDPGQPNPIAAIEGRIAAGYNFNAWDLNGIVTTMQEARDGLTTLSITDPVALFSMGPTETMVFSGETVDGSSVLIKYTWAGDLNVDGIVDASDYGIIDNYFQFPGTQGYANGDFNFDGIIDAGDYGLIDNAFQLQHGVL